MSDKPTPRPFSDWVKWGHARPMPLSSVTWPGELPDKDAPPWACLSEPGTPVVLRRYDATSRTCDVVSSHGRWLLESSLIPRHPIGPSEVQYGWDLAVGDVEPGWCIVYAGHELWFPQRVLRVETIDEDWQRVWTLGDQSTRDVWESDWTYAWDNGLATGWSYDEMAWPHWPEGPWWPLQSSPLSDDARRFLLDRFDIAVECPECGKFGQPIVFGLVLSPPAHVAIGGCCITGDDPDYVCECGAGWTVTEEGTAHVPLLWGANEGLHAAREAVGALEEPLEPLSAVDESGEEIRPSIVEAEAAPEAGQLIDAPWRNYDIAECCPYGDESEYFFQDVQAGLLEEAGGAWKVPEGGGEEEFDADLYVHYWGQARYDMDLEDMLPERDWGPPE